MEKVEYCDACGCSPCDCGWGSYIKTRVIYVKR
jgi:hypothetical protein